VPVIIDDTWHECIENEGAIDRVRERKERTNRAEGDRWRVRARDTLASVLPVRFIPEPVALDGSFPKTARAHVNRLKSNAHARHTRTRLNARQHSLAAEITHPTSLTHTHGNTEQQSMPQHVWLRTQTHDSTQLIPTATLAARIPIRGSSGEGS
jgi:hypothetical protein